MLISIIKLICVIGLIIIAYRLGIRVGLVREQDRNKKLQFRIRILTKQVDEINNRYSKTEHESENAYFYIDHWRVNIMYSVQEATEKQAIEKAESLMELFKAAAKALEENDCITLKELKKELNL